MKYIFWHKMTMSSVTQSVNRSKVSENGLKEIIILKAYQRDLQRFLLWTPKTIYITKTFKIFLKQANIDTCI